MTAPHQAAGDALREAVCAFLWAEMHPHDSVTWAEVVEIAAKHPRNMGAMRVKDMRARAERMIAGPLAPVLAARAAAEAEVKTLTAERDGLKAALEMLSDAVRVSNGHGRYDDGPSDEPGEGFLERYMDSPNREEIAEFFGVTTRHGFTSFVEAMIAARVALRSQSDPEQATSGRAAKADGLLPDGRTPSGSEPPACDPSRGGAV